MTKIILGVLVAVALIAAPAGQAAPFTPELELAYAIADEYWGGPPPNCTSIDKQIVPHGSLDEGELNVSGRATQPQQPEPCILYLDRALAEPDLFGEACDTMIHEDGHLHGLGHSDDPKSVMYPIETASVKHCRRIANLLLGAHEVGDWIKATRPSDSRLRFKLAKRRRFLTTLAWAPLCG